MWCKLPFYLTGMPSEATLHSQQFDCEAWQQKRKKRNFSLVYMFFDAFVLCTSFFSFVFAPPWGWCCSFMLVLTFILNNNQQAAYRTILFLSFPDSFWRLLCFEKDILYTFYSKEDEHLENRLKVRYCMLTLSYLNYVAVWITIYTYSKCCGSVSLSLRFCRVLHIDPTFRLHSA